MIDIGFIGLGTMGRPMALHRGAPGHRLLLQDLGPIAPDSSRAAHGGKAWDHSAMVRALEMMASHETAVA